jgi:hypothetical protein
MPDLDLDLHARANAHLAEMVNSLANGFQPMPPVVIASEAVASPTIHEAYFEPALNYGTSWQQRLFPSEKPINIDEARGELRAAIIARAAAAVDLAAAADELARADAMLAEIAAAQVELAEEGRRRIANLAGRLRQWVAAGEPGDRPACGAFPSAPAPREAELTAARLARAGVAADHDAAHAAHALAIEAVDRSRCLVLTAEAQAIASRYSAALTVLGKLEADGGALLGLTLAGMPALAGLVRERLPASLAPAGGDDAAARWADYSRRLDYDPEAKL